MLRKNLFNTQLTGIPAGVIAGGAIGLLAGLIYETGAIGSYALRFYFAAIPASPIAVGTFSGIFVGAAVSGMAILKSRRLAVLNHTSENKDFKLQLRKEQLHITRKPVKTGEVSIRKEVLTEMKNITVPVVREELVITKGSKNKEFLGEKYENHETIRIPISEERIELNKHTVPLKDVKIYKRVFNDIEHIEEVVKKEELRVETKRIPED